MAPPYIWDDVAYNLALPKQYLEFGYFRYISEYNFYSVFPLFSDALNTLLLNAAGYIPTHILGSWAYLALGLITYRFCILLEIKKPLSVLSSILVLSAPCIFFTAPIAKPDGLIALYLITSFYLLSLQMKSTRYHSWFLRLLPIFFVSFSMGLKYSAAYLLPGFFIFFWCIYLQTKQQKDLIFITKYIILCLVIFFSINSIWLYRNYIETGNPIFPMLKELFPDKLPYHFSAYRSNLVHELLYSMKEMSFNQSHSIKVFLARVKNQSHLLPFLSILVAPVLLLINGKKNYSFNFKVYLCLSLIAFFTILELFFFLTWELRHIPTISVLMCILFAYSVSFFIVDDKKINLICYTLSLLLLFKTISTLYNSYSPAISCVSMDKNALISCAENKASHGKVARYLNNHLSDKDVVAINTQPFFYLNKKYLIIHPWTETADLISDDDPLTTLMKLKKLGITYIAWSKLIAEDISAYDIKYGPNIINWFVEIDKNINYLSSYGYLIKKDEIEDVIIFKVE